MASIADIIDIVHPAVNEQGVVLSDEIWVLFDRELDEFSINDGNFFVEGPDTDSFFGPSIGISLPNVSQSTSNDQLSSPGYRGIVQGKISFERVENSTLNQYSGFDYSGIGTAYRTKAVFKSKYALQKNTTYTVHLSGDEAVSDNLSTGIRARSVFDYTKGANLGTGELAFEGTFLGTATSDSYNVKCVVSGVAGVAKFIWWKTSNPSLIKGPITSLQYAPTLLDDGIKVKWKDGTFNVNDSFSVVVRKPELFSGNMYWNFVTSDGAIQTVPTAASQPVGSTPVTTTATLSINSISPANFSVKAPETFKRIEITFSEAIDPATVTNTSVELKAFGLLADLDDNALDIYKNITVSGNKITLDF